MADISKIKANNVTYTLKDLVSRANIIQSFQYGTKNLLPITYRTQTVGSEVTYTVNDNGTITATVIKATTSNRNATACDGFSLKAGTYYFSTDAPDSGGTSSDHTHAYVYDGSTGTTIAEDYGDKHTFILSEDKDDIRIYIRVRSGTPLGYTVTFKPMICSIADHTIDPTFVPYAPTNRELYLRDFAYFRIPNGSDLNGTWFRKNGVFLSPNSTCTNSLLNCPYRDGGFVMEVTVASSTAILNRLYPTGPSGAGTYYSRGCRSASSSEQSISNDTITWGNWFIFQGTEIVPE